MALDPAPMKPAEARWHLLRLGVTQDRFAKIIRVNPSTFRRWIDPTSGFPMPRPVQLLLRLISAADMRRLIKADDDNSPA